jgi:hypothetical protein
VSDMTSYSIALALGIRDTIATLRAELAAARERVEAAEKERAEWEATCRAHVENVRMARETLGIVEKERDKYRAEADALRAFKAYVHQRLDDAGVPTHPDGPHSKEGCRVGDRLDILIDSGRYWVGQYREAEARERALTEERDAYAEEMRAERSCKDAAQRANSELWRQVEALTEDNARLRESMARASAELRHAYKAKDVNPRGIDPNLVARAIETLEYADLASRPPVCAACSDTRVMALGDRSVPCTRCPTPCERCRRAAYCAETPCRCACHAKPDAPEAKCICAHAPELHSTEFKECRVFTFAQGPCPCKWDGRAAKKEDP